MEKIEYRVRPVTRFIVTRFADYENATQQSSTHGEFDNADVAYQVGYALCKAEQDRLGWPPGDERIQYPKEIEPGMQIGGPQPQPAHHPNHFGFGKP